MAPNATPALGVKLRNIDDLQTSPIFPRSQASTKAARRQRRAAWPFLRRPWLA
jgi:hypothetical protein